jgi:hypothetical protein
MISTLTKPNLNTSRIEIVRYLLIMKDIIIFKI